MAAQEQRKGGKKTESTGEILLSANPTECTTAGETIRKSLAAKSIAAVAQSDIICALNDNL